MKFEFFVFLNVLLYVRSLYQRFFEEIYTKSNENDINNIILYAFLINALFVIYWLYHRYWEEKLIKTPARNNNILRYHYSLYFKIDYLDILDTTEDILNFNKLDYIDTHKDYKNKNRTISLKFSTNEKISDYNYEYINLVFFEMVDYIYINKSGGNFLFMKNGFLFYEKDIINPIFSFCFSIKNKTNIITLKFYLKHTYSFLKLNDFGDEIFFRLYEDAYSFFTHDVFYFEYNNFDAYKEYASFPLILMHFPFCEENHGYFLLYYFLNNNYDFLDKNNKNNFFDEKYQKYFYLDILKESPYNYNIDKMMGNYYEFNCNVKQLNEKKSIKENYVYTYKNKYYIYINYYKF